MPLILGFGYKRRSGKNTAAKFAAAHLAFTKPKLKVKQVSFADKLKSVAHQLYSWAGLREGGYYEDHADEKESALPALLEYGAISPRDIYIKIGQAMRAIHPETWVESAFSGMSNYDVLLITDVRFVNEANRINSFGGKVFNILRPDAPLLNDPSEKALDGYIGFTDTLVNDGSLKAFNELVVATVDKHLQLAGY